MKNESRGGGNKLLTIIGIILCVILIPILVINCTLLAKSVTGGDEVPSIGGVFPMIILTDSMSGVFEAGDLIICNKAEPESVAEGDIICYFDPEGNGVSTVTHRVMEVTTDENGGIAWITKGDANNAEDSTPVPAENLIGKYKSKLSGLGNVAMFMQTTKGLAVCVLCPIIILVAYDVLRRRHYDKTKQDDTEALMAELKALREEKAEKDAEKTEEIVNNQEKKAEKAGNED